MTKSKLKEKGSYYYEERDWYENCPAQLPQAPIFKVEVFPRIMSHREILDTYKVVPYASYAEAASVVISIIPDLKYPSRIVYFKEDGVLYRFDAWRRDGGQLVVDVYEVRLGFKYVAEYGVCFSNSTSDTLGAGPLDSSEPSALASAIELVKSHGYRIFKEV